MISQVTCGARDGDGDVTDSAVSMGCERQSSTDSGNQCYDSAGNMMMAFKLLHLLSLGTSTSDYEQLLEI